MKDINIPLLGLLLVSVSFIIGFILSRFLLTKKISEDLEAIKSEEIKLDKVKEQLDYSNLELIDTRDLLLKSEKDNLDIKRQMNKKLDQTLTDLKNELSEKERLIGELKSQLLTKDAEFLKILQEEKEKSYDEGVEKSLADYKVTCRPFLYTKKGFFKSYMTAGFKYQLLVKGIPVFNNEFEYILERHEKFDEEAKKTILQGVSETLDQASGKLGGILMQKFPTVIKNS